ncbi:MAG: hypothetical protein ABIG45_04195 [Bacillota bacterium]
MLSAGEEKNIEITEVATEIGENFVLYPQLEGMQNPAIQQAINDAIVEQANIVQRIFTLSTLEQGGTGLQVSYTACLEDSLFSTVISARWMMENLRSGHHYTALSYDLQTGERLQLSDFFTDPDAAVSWMEEQLLDGYTDELTGYLEYADVTPLPVDSFTFDENGISFWYPYKQFALLSGYSGAVQFQYGELQEFLIKDDGCVPARLGAVLPEYNDMQIREAIEAVAAQGALPYLPVRLGDSLPDLIAEYRLVRMPDQYPGGRYFQFEAPAFRQVLVMSDALTQEYAHSVAEGILATRMNLYGLQTGVTTRERWLAILGEPLPSVYLDESLAADYGLPEGTADYYPVAGRQLMLYADANDVLFAVRLSK